ncbi:MAG: hypothetical protein IJF01_06820 [Tidjanibacter sp.]|nr:hypothetical protein [Tidjanibacter sp.]
MERMEFWSNFVAEGYLWQSLVGLGLLLVAFAVQFYFIVGRLGRIASYRNPAPSPEAEQVGISVIVPLFEADFRFLEESLPVLLAQRHKPYEVVLVNVTGNEDFTEQIKLLKITNPRLSSTIMRADPLFPISTKMALNVGIKAARYDHLLFTLPTCTPRSERWAEVMARGFVGHDVVLGYTSLQPFKGVWSRSVRVASLCLSAGWIADAVAGAPWRGELSNLGFTKSVYYGARGFNHLNLNSGEDDLFVSKIATRENTSLVLGGPATMTRRVWGGYGWWKEQRLAHAPLHRHYSARIKWLRGVELWSRALFVLSVVGVALLLPPVAGYVALGMWVVREAAAMLVALRTARRLSERCSLAVYPLYDLVAPAIELALYVKRIFAPKHTWKSKST